MRLNKLKKKKRERRTRNESSESREEIAEPIEEITIDPPIISNFSENYPIHEEQDLPKETGMDNPISDIEEVQNTPEEKTKKKRGEKIVESLEGDTKSAADAIFKCRK